MSTVDLTLKLMPTDVLMFRESRPFGEVGTHTGSEPPRPRTVAGAVRTWLLECAGVDLRDFAKALKAKNGAATTAEALRGLLGEEMKSLVDVQISGPLLADAGRLLYPAPRHVVRLKDNPEDNPARLGLLLPAQESPPGYSPPPGAPDTFRPLWLHGGAEWEPLEDGFFTDFDMGPVLQGLVQEGLAEQMKQASDVMRREPRFGIALEPGKRTVIEGKLYANEFLRLSNGDDAGLFVRLTMDTSLGECVTGWTRQRPWLRLGGEGRMAGIELLEEAVNLVDAGTVWAEATHFYTVQVTPGLFENGGWYPKGLADKHELLGAITGEPFPVSGWDVAAGRPLPTRYAVAPGAVYFWKKRDGDAPDPHGTHICDDPEDNQAGWGLCLRGAWNHGG